MDIGENVAGRGYYCSIVHAQPSGRLLPGVFIPFSTVGNYPHTKREGGEVVVKVVINRCFGGFGLSDEAIEWLIQNKGWKVVKSDEEGKLPDEESENQAPIIEWHPHVMGGLGRYSIIRLKYGNNSGGFRINPDLIEVIEVLGEKANGRYAELKIVEIPNDVEWSIEEYDGVEWIAEKHRTWK